MIDFNIEDAESAEKDFTQNFSRLHLTDFQMTIVDNITEFLDDKLVLSVFALKGFIYRAVKVWQQTMEKPGNSIESFTPKERIEAVRSMFKTLETLLKPALKNSTDDEELTRIMTDGLKFYTDKFAYRED